ncbi:hypothetical protein P3T76_004152 [Phytophthora citrophthora]|uniref:FYVE-type domain-containing protein n=1 Tax=Phytophthora citrophthora TaxID=4793 RepID=A0AAD9LP15_9STRA|nr:hypothetical protein P3T76_004152 [Phytophthora citrophthora]
MAAVDDEQQARLCGRARAKEIFQPMRWKRIGTLPDEAAKLYESARRQSSSHSYSLRAVKPLQASLAEVEAVLTGQTALLGKDDTPSLLARLLPATYVSGGRIARYPTLEHSTSERENVAMQYARLKPYTAQHPGQENKNAVLLESVDNYVLLGYTLSTRLQRSDTSKRKNSTAATPRTTAVPSLLHLYRPVSAPSFAERRHDFRAERLADHDFSITYIIQEMLPNEKDQQKEEATSVTLEVVLTCSLDPRQAEVGADGKAKEILNQQKQRLRHDALCLTRLQPFIDAYRQEKTRPSLSTNQPREPQHDPKDCDPNLLRGSMFAGGRTCGVCHRKFGPFRWKRHCETCEKLVCNQCLSVLAAAPSLSRRKKRVCSQCLYGETANVAAMHKATADVHDDKSSVSSAGSAKAHASPENSTMNVFQFPNIESLVSKHKASRPAAPVPQGTPSRASGRVQIDLGLDPALASSRNSDRRRARSRQSQLSQGSVTSNTSSTSFVAATHDRRATLASHIDLDDSESAISKSMRTRRAKTVLLDDQPVKPVTYKPLNFITPLSSSAPTHSLYSTLEEKEENQPHTSKPRASSCRSSKIQFVQLKTPEPNYELDFNWYNIFPKAPVERTTEELARAKYVEVTGLKVDARSLVFLRHDTELEELARRVLDVASQWHGCSINIVGSYEVYCLVTASNKPELDLDDDEMLELEASPVTVDDVVPREESVSAYAVHHRSPFFVPEMEHDPRFRAHPLHTEQGAVSFLSFPIYSSGADTNGSLSHGEAYCVATLDMWKRDHVPASSHVSNDWISNVGDLLRKISARLEALTLESHAFLKPRARANHSFGSSCDSRDSTRRADSIVDLYDIDSESVVDSPPLSQAETMDRLTNLSYAKVRGLGLGSMSGPGSATWKYDSDNESTTSSQSASSACSQSSRFSSHQFSAADMHSTIESLLQQASKTSQYISETGVSI